MATLNLKQGVGNLVKLNEKSAEWQFIAERRRGKPLEDEETVVLEADDTGESGASDEGSEYERSGDGMEHPCNAVSSRSPVQCP